MVAIEIRIKILGRFKIHFTNEFILFPVSLFCSPSYNISITGIKVGNSSLNYDFSAIVDSGTSFTTLADPMYTAITTSVSTSIFD